MRPLLYDSGFSHTKPKGNRMAKPLKIIKGETFNETDVVLDGNEFVDCVFAKCNWHFLASRRFKIDESKFIDGKESILLLFEKHAHFTLWFLSYLYRLPGQKALVERIFQDIRDQKIDEPEDEELYF